MPARKHLAQRISCRRRIVIVGVCLAIPFTTRAPSYYGVGQHTQFAGIEPVPERNVFFAGEQTSYRQMSYVNGAVISGERAAREIISATGNVFLSS